MVTSRVWYNPKLDPRCCFVQDVPPSVVKLLVIENLMLVPSMDVYILPFSFLHYQVQRRKHGIMEVVPLPSPHHSLHLTNSIVAQLRNSTSRVLGVELGFTEVVLEDHSILQVCWGGRGGGGGGEGYYLKGGSGI